MSGDVILPEVEIREKLVAGELQLANRAQLSDFKGFVCITFERRVDGLSLSPQEALDMSEKLGRQAYRARFGDFPSGMSKQTMEQLRIRCRNRVLMMLKEEPKTPTAKKIRAAHIVDEVMKLVT